MRALALLAVVAGCGRLHFDPLADGAPAADAAIDAAIDAPLVACGGVLPAACPPSGSMSIATGGHVHVSGETSGLADGMTGSCGGGGSAEFILQLDFLSFGFFNVSTAGSTFDTIIYVLDGSCSGTEVQCQSSVAGTGGEMMMLGLAHAGTFFIVVDGVNGCGHVELDVQG